MAKMTDREKEAYKERLLIRLKNGFKTHSPKNEDGEYIIMRAGKRMNIYGQSLWPNKARAEKAAIKYFKKSNYYYKNASSIWNAMARNIVEPNDLHTYHEELLNNELKRITFMPLKDFIIFEEKRLNNKKNGG